jgi:hypothetical protein
VTLLRRQFCNAATCRQSPLRNHGLAARTTAATPVTSGQAIEVPSQAENSLGTGDVMATPGAITSSSSPKLLKAAEKNWPLASR